MDIFALRQRVIADYEAYTRSFLSIRDPEIEEFVQQELEKGKLWPDALVQLSPSYAIKETVERLATSGVLHPLCASIFRGRNGQSLTLYAHQRRAIDLAQLHQPYVVTTGTGSGKSLTYTIPIVDHILRNKPEAGRVRAIIVYPMNALINSQLDGLKRFFGNLSEAEQIIRFERYTGQEREADKKRIQENPPHILLTNYVMLELMLTRPDEFAFVDAGSAALQFIVLDELHTYRGRQGADVALLMRRLRDRSGNPNLQCIGTSATMVSGSSPEEQRRVVAQVASTIFGVDLPPDNVVEETLIHAVSHFNKPTVDQLRDVLHSPLPEHLTLNVFKDHPLAAWIDQNFSVNEQSGMLRRVRPQSLVEGARRLAQLTGVDETTCMASIERMFQLGSDVVTDENKSAFAFKLHQFVSQGGAVYTTLEASEKRYLTLEGQRYVAGENGDRLLFPLVFCRDCGQHYAMVSYDRTKEHIEPRTPMSRGDDVQEPAEPGYLLIGENVWNEEDQDLLPESWFNPPRRIKISKKYEKFVPKRLFVEPDGTVRNQPGPTTEVGWYVPMPFMVCLCCGVVYTQRDDDYRKLARLSSEGRSTATTLLSVATIDAMRNTDLAHEAKKLLSFTDNRQDASLQAGHFNDFTAVALLRSATAKALREAPQPLDYRSVAKAVMKALDLEQSAYIRNDKQAAYGGALRRNNEAFEALLEYRLYEDLRRSWRITQPNLEQCGLLTIDYLDLAELCADPKPWHKHPLLATCPPDLRETTIRTMLDHMRRELAIDAPTLDADKQRDLVKHVNQYLNDIWKFEEDEGKNLRKSTRYVLPSEHPLPPGGRTLSTRSAIGRFLRTAKSWNPDAGVNERLDEQVYIALLNALFDILASANIVADLRERDQRFIQIRADALLWLEGNGEPPPPDVIRGRWMSGERKPHSRKPNEFFTSFYKSPTPSLRAIEGREHTGQVAQRHREDREARFSKGQLPVLFCSPTMELGIDISDLNVVHMRNVPPTPANYAQRSGRAGRSGQPALVMTYCSSASGHDQYFFDRPLDMVAGAVAPPQLDLANEDLMRAHVHAVWLAAVGLDLTRSILNLVDAGAPGIPLRDDIRAQILVSPEVLERCLQACMRMLGSRSGDVQAANWFSDEWLRTKLHNAADTFDAAFTRWRTLYKAADAEVEAANQAIQQSYQQAGNSEAFNQAKQRREEAERQLRLLGNNPASSSNTSSRQTDGDFYPYRYLASEGFLPGYNFPRLPVRSFLSGVDDEGAFLSRPRFLAITEFGPRTVIYHEGRKFRVNRTQLPAGGAQQALWQAQACNRCGYFHRDAGADVCEQCGTLLEGDKVRHLPFLLEMTTALARQTERITCEEEERSRQGFTLTTHFQFSQGNAGLRRIEATAGDDLLRLTYGPAATIWRVNHGWRRSKQEGFALNERTGEWGSAPTEQARDDAAETEPMRQGIKLAVYDTRNILLVEPPAPLCADEEFMRSLQYALERGIAAVFQLEEQELTSELLGHTQQRRILFWEASEGGAGVLRRLVEEPNAFARVAYAALEICHFDPATSADALSANHECARACYRCLLSYSNQQSHSLLNRFTIRDGLIELAQAGVVVEPAPSQASSATANEAALSEAAAHVLALIRSLGGHEPHAILPDVLGHRPHFQYGPRQLIVCPEPGASIGAMRDDLEDAGYTVLVVRPDGDIPAQLMRVQFWKGER